MSNKEKLERGNKNHTSHIALHTSQNGITLIALIITIIVMLILVGVTINVALNGGLFTKASEASKQMQVEADRETLLSAVVAAIGYDGKVVLEDLELPTGWTGGDGTYTSPKGNTFTVTADGKITYTGENTGGGNTPVAFTWESLGLKVDTAVEYGNTSMSLIVNFTENGKINLMKSDGEIILQIDATNPKNIVGGKIDCQIITVYEEPVNIKVKMNENNNDIDVEIEGIGTIACEKQAKTTYSNEEVLKMLGISDSTGTYNGGWTVLESGADGSPTKLVSTRNVASYGLGCEDPRAIEAIPIVGAEPTEEEEFKRGIWSYKNAVTTLKTVVEEATGIENARSIEIEDIYGVIGNDFIGSVNSEYGRIYNYYYNTEDSKVYEKYQTGTDDNGEIIWSTGTSTGYSSQTFVDDDGNTVVVDSENDNVTLTYSRYYYELTEDQKAEIGALASGSYWLASPCVECDSWSKSVDFDMRCMGNGSITQARLFRSFGRGAYLLNGVRAVVSI